MSNTTFNYGAVQSVLMTEEELLEATEAWRKRHGLNKREFCKLAGIKNSQTYGNWLRAVFPFNSN